MKKIISIVILLVLIVSSILYYVINFQLETFYRIGYRKEELNYVKSLNKDTKELLKNYPKIEQLQHFIEDERVDQKRLKDYLDLLNRHQDRYEDVIVAVNLGMNLKEYEEYRANIFKDDPYYLAFNKKRYEQAYNKFKKEKDAVRKTVEFVNAKADLKPYEDVFASDLTQGNLVLVNKYNYLPNDYIPDDLVSFPEGMGSGTIRQEAFDQFVSMHQEAAKKGYQLISISPFRSYQSQYSLYNSYAASDGTKNADRYSARAGFSEHQTGLVIDISIPGYSIEAFGDTKAYQWMQENAYRYGFIERYPLNKEEVTGYIHEPWHYRYVGKDVAKELHIKKITFDEYYEYYVVGGRKDV